MSGKCFVKCTFLYTKRGLFESKRTIFSILGLAIVLTIIVVMSISRDIDKETMYISSEKLGYYSNLYAIFMGATIGFVASVITSSISSIYYQDRVSHFVEIILSTPITPRTYILSITTASIIHSAISYTAISVVYTAVSITSSNLTKQVLLNRWVYLIGFLVTLLTSLIAIVIYVLAIKLSIDPSKLSVIPSMSIFLIILSIKSLLGIDTLSNEYLYMFITILSAVNLLIILTIVVAGHRLGGEYLISL